jgi:hypothetical protein
MASPHELKDRVEAEAVPGGADAATARLRAGHLMGKDTG